MNHKRPGRQGFSHQSFVKVAAVAAVFAASIIAAPAADAVTGLQVQSLSDTLTPTNLASTLVGSGVTISNACNTPAQTARRALHRWWNRRRIDHRLRSRRHLQLWVRWPTSWARTRTPIRPWTTGNRATPISTDSWGQTTQDTAARSFNFTADASSVSFRYVFASEEYNEYVDSKL